MGRLSFQGLTNGDDPLFDILIRMTVYALVVDPDSALGNIVLASVLLEACGPSLGIQI